MYDWQEQQRRTNEQGAAWLQRQQEEQRRREEEQRRRDEERRRREEEERQREVERRQRSMDEQNRQWKEQQKNWEDNSRYTASSSYSSAEPDVPWSSFNWFEKLFWILFLLVFRIPLFLGAFVVLEGIIRSWLFSNAEQNPESFITLQILTYYFLFLKTVYEIVAPIIQVLFESVIQFIQSF